MAYTYSAATVGSNTTHSVRFLLQDNTNTTARPALLDDDEIAWVLTTEKNIYMAAALIADTLASRFRGTSSKKVGELELRYDTKYWEGIASKLRARGQSHQVLSAGGVLTADRDALFEDTDLIQPEMFKDMQQDPKTQGPSTVPVSEQLLP